MTGSSRPRARRAAVAALASALTVASSGAAQPAPAASGQADPPAPAPKWYEAISVHAFLSASFGYNFERPASRTNQLRAFDTEDGSARLDVAQLVVQKRAEAPGEAGFRLDALAGASVPRLTAASGLFRDPETGDADDFDLLQAFVRWIAPVGRGLTLDAGKFVTSAGCEAIDGYEAWNDQATHSFLFGVSEPSTHTGLKAAYAFSDRLSAELLLVNGWDDVKDANGAKTLGAGLTLSPGPGVTLTANVLHGPERRANDADDRTLVGLVARAETGRGFTVALHLERGAEEGLGPDGGVATWWGAAGYVRWDASPLLALALRGERFVDADGARTGSAQTLHEVTLTPSLTLAPSLVVRADLRLDLSDREVFEGRDGLLTKRRQATVLLNALYAY